MKQFKIRIKDISKVKININENNGYVLNQASGQSLRSQDRIIRKPSFDFSRRDMNPNLEDPIVYKYRNK